MQDTLNTGDIITEEISVHYTLISVHLHSHEHENQQAKFSASGNRVHDTQWNYTDLRFLRI